MKWKEQLLTLSPYKPGRSIEDVKRQYGLEKIVKLASNENPFGCSVKVAEALKNTPVSFAIYPDGNATDLKESLAAFYKIAPEQLILGNGSDNLIQIISRSILRKGLNTVMAVPTFSQYKHNAIIEGAEIREIPLANGHHDLDGMLSAIDANTGIVWVCNPDNPTGTYIPKEKLYAFLEKVPKDVLVVLDEAYYEYVEEDDYDVFDLVSQFKNVIVLRTFSKIYGLASLRVGYGIAASEVIRAIEPAREPFNVNTFAQKAAIAALEDQEYIQLCKQKNREGLKEFYQFCQDSNLEYYPSQTNFILIDFKIDGDEVFQFLLEKGYIVRSGKALGFPTSVRVTVGSKEQNEGVIEAMKQFLKVKSLSRINGQ